MAGILLSGPAFGGKSRRARAILAAVTRPTALVDFTLLWATLTDTRRDPKTGRFPDRDDDGLDGALLPMIETVRQAAIRIAGEREVDVIATNSDGRPARRRYLLNLIGGGAVEEVVDPGRAVAARRAREHGEACEVLLDRWYGRLDDA